MPIFFRNLINTTNSVKRRDSRKDSLCVFSCAGVHDLISCECLLAAHSTDRSSGFFTPRHAIASLLACSRRSVQNDKGYRLKLDPIIR
jgi:hypothetical protein